MKYNLVYAMLTDAGHSAPKAIELIIDAQRGDKRALDWIRILKTHRSLPVAVVRTLERKAAIDDGASAELRLFGQTLGVYRRKDNTFIYRWGDLVVPREVAVGVIHNLA